MDINNQLTEIRNNFYKHFGLSPIPREYIALLLFRNIDSDTIFTIGVNAYARNNGNVKNKFYKRLYK
ncbi:MAG: hypothetical protein ABF331_02885 [Hellea sp.]